MKVEVNEKPVEQKTEYPCLKVSDKTGNIVLFISPKTGIVVVSNSHLWELAEYSDSFDESNFTPFVGSITLSND